MVELIFNEPVIVWLPLNLFEPVVANEPVFEFTLALNVLTDDVNVLNDDVNNCILSKAALDELNDEVAELIAELTAFAALPV
jgi:hypothetical protein